jgi:hypothetical protein
MIVDLRELAKAATTTAQKVAFQSIAVYIAQIKGDKELTKKIIAFLPQNVGRQKVNNVSQRAEIVPNSTLKPICDTCGEVETPNPTSPELIEKMFNSEAVPSPEKPKAIEPNAGYDIKFFLEVLAQDAGVTKEEIGKELDAEGFKYDKRAYNGTKETFLIYLIKKYVTSEI